MENQKVLEENSTYLLVENRTVDKPALDYKHFDEAAAVISLFLFIAIVTLNGAVIYVLVFKHKKKNRLYFFVLHLAIADILLGFVCVLGDGLQSALYGAYYGEDVLCRIWRYSKVVTVMASNNMLIGMSIDRFLAIKFPLRTARLGACIHLDKTLVFGAWLISLVAACLYLPYSVGVTAKLTDIGYCDLDLPKNWWQPYVIVVSFLVYILPTLGITTCYVGICFVVWRKWKSGLRLSEINRNAHNNKVNSERASSMGLLPKAKVKSIKMTVVICLVFFICWTPYFVFMLLDVHDPSWISDRRLFVPLSMLYPLNSACNPLIFILFNLKLFFTCRVRRPPQPATSFEAISTNLSTMQ